MNEKTTVAQNSGMTMSDISYVLFRQKWKIILCTAAGLLAANTLFMMRPPPYQSEAKLLIRYVVDDKSPSAVGTDTTKIKSPDPRGESIINSEVEILTSFDLAQQVADSIGPAKILAKAGGRKQPHAATASLVNPGDFQLGPDIAGGNERMAAAGLVNRNLTVEVPKRSNVIRIVFEHQDPKLVQPVLGQLVDDYLKKHVQIHKAVGTLDDFLTQEADVLRSRIALTDEELVNLKVKAGVVSLIDAKNTYAHEESRLRQELFDSEANLAERQAALKSLKQAPFDQIDEYHRIRRQLDFLYNREQTLRVEFTEESTIVKGVLDQIVDAEKQKTKMEERNPALASLYLRALKNGGRLTAAASFDVTTQETQTSALESKIKVLNAQLEQVRSEAARLDRVEVELTDLQRKKGLEETNYRSISERLEQSRIDESLGDGKVSNISKIQAPSPPVRNMSKSVRTSVMLIIGGLGFGLAWAFLTEFYLDSSVRRPRDIESKFQMPVFLSMPDIGRRMHRRLARPVRNEAPSLHDSGDKASPLKRVAIVGSATKSLSELTREKILSNAPSENRGREENGQHPLHPYYEALRDRLAVYFEGKDLTHKPKLVAVTGAAKGSGVTTVAAGLASCLAETGDGKVLLVDMHPDQDAARQFHGGRPVCGLDEALESETSIGALVQGRLYVVADGSNGDRLSRVSPKRFTDVLSKLKASGYDYIIFDMPPVSQTSVTPRLAGSMDLTVLVIESEKTDREAVREASALLTESKANVCAVLNKTRNYVPSRVHREFLSDPYGEAPAKPRWFGSRRP